MQREPYKVHRADLTDPRKAVACVHNAGIFSWLTSLPSLLAMSAIAHTHQNRLLRVKMLYISSKVSYAYNAVFEFSEILIFSTMGKFILKRQQPKMLVDTLTTDGHGQHQQPHGSPKDDHLLAYRKYCSALGIGTHPYFLPSPD